jgi:hypothetical protein
MKYKDDAEGIQYWRSDGGPRSEEDACVLREETAGASMSKDYYPELNYPWPSAGLNAENCPCNRSDKTALTQKGE